MVLDLGAVVILPVRIGGFLQVKGQRQVWLVKMLEAVQTLTKRDLNITSPGLDFTTPYERSASPAAGCPQPTVKQFGDTASFIGNGFALTTLHDARLKIARLLTAWQTFSVITSCIKFLDLMVLLAVC